MYCSLQACYGINQCDDHKCPHPGCYKYTVESSPCLTHRCPGTTGQTGIVSKMSQCVERMNLVGIFVKSTNIYMDCIYDFFLEVETFSFNFYY